MKTCTRCGMEKELGEFPKSSSGKWGRDARCKTCKNTSSRKRTPHKPRHPKPETGYKRCPTCERVLEVTKFSASSSSTDGLQTYCSECRRKRWSDERELNRYRRMEVTSLKADIREVKRSLGLLESRTDKQRLRSVFSQMQQRCGNPNSNKYKYYGARGITVKFKNLEEFRTWSFENGYREGLQIDRINNDGDYEPGNCRWVTGSENMFNTGRSRKLTAFGETKNLLEWSRDTRCNVTYKQLVSRYDQCKTWSHEDMITRIATKRRGKKGVVPND